MKIKLGGQPRELPEGTSVAALLAHEQVENPQFVTVSVNETFVRPENFDTHLLQDGDEVEFLFFMGGGAGEA